jgi:hypothetical protein
VKQITYLHLVTVKNILIITGFMDFVYRPEFKMIIKHNVSETGSVSVLRGGFREIERHLLCRVP